jgi:hypothetical protein
MKKGARQNRTQKVSIVNDTLGPRPILLQPILRRRQQYQVATANVLNNAITAGTIGKMAVGFMALTATTSAFISNQFRVRKISLWSPPPVQGSLTQNSLKYSDTNTVSGITGPSQFFGDSSMEPDRPARCFIKAPPGTPYAQFFTVTGTANFFVMTCPIGSIVELDYEHYLDNSGTLTAGPTLSGATAGVLYNATVTLSGGATLVPLTSINTIAA